MALGSAPGRPQGAFREPFCRNFGASGSVRTRNSIFDQFWKEISSFSMSFRRRRLCDFRRVFDRSGCCAASCRKYANPAKVLRIVRKIAISESSAFAHVAQSSCSTYHCAHANACVSTMLSACSKNHRKFKCLSKPIRDPPSG